MYEQFFLSDFELCERLGLNSRKTPWALTARGILPRPVKIGRMSRWWWPDVVAKLRDIPAADRRPSIPGERTTVVMG